MLLSLVHLVQPTFPSHPWFTLLYHSDNLWKSISEVVTSVTMDESFQASAAVTTANEMSKYLSNEANREVINKYSYKLYDMLMSCLTSKYKRSQFQCEKMWMQYHKLRGSDAYYGGHSKLDFAGLGFQIRFLTSKLQISISELPN